MTVIDSSACRTSGSAGQAAATQSANGSRGSPQDRADALVRATVLSDLGQSAGHGRHSHGIQGVAAAVRKVLSAQDVTGTDAADDVLKKIETSLHKAAQALADRGVDGKTIDATIDKFRAQLAHALDRGGSGAASGAGATSGSGAASGGGSSGATTGAGGAGGGVSSGAASGSGGADSSGPASDNATPAATTGTTSVSTFVSREVRKERGAIDLVTAEGDHVSIRFRTKDVVAGSVTQATGADGTTVSATTASAFSRGGVKIEVDGNLNDDELKAIGDLLGKVDDIATKFFSGDVQAAFSAAGSLGVDSDQIAGYRLNLTYSRKIAAAAYGVSATSLPVSTQTPASSSTSDGTTQGDSSTGAVPSANSASGSTASAPTAPTDSSSSAASTPASAQKTLIDFISDTLSKLGSANGTGRVSFSTHWKVNVLVTALQSMQPTQPTQPTKPADQTAANNTQLFGDSLQKIAAA